MATLEYARRRFLGFAAALLPALAHAQLRGRAMRIVVPNAPGGAADITARLIAERLGALLNQTVIVDNRPGAGGVVAGEVVARAEPDGRTLLLVSSGTAVSAALFKALPFDVLEDFAPISLTATFDLALVAKGGGRFAALADFLALARAHPGELNLGTPQIGTTQHVAAELFKSTAGIDVQIVPFNGTPALVTALRGGQIDAAVDILGPLMPQIGSHALTALAVLGADRAPQLPAVATAASAGGPLAHLNVTSWNGLAAPGKTPYDVIERLNRAVTAALAEPDVRRRLLAINLVAQASSPQQLGARMRADVQRWAGVIERARIPRQ